MAVIVVTRLRLKDPALLDEFFTDALAAIEQAQKSDGNLGADALADANNAWWTVTAWQERRLMRSYVRTEPHRSIAVAPGPVLRRGDVRGLGAGQPGPAGLADELASPGRRRPGGRALPAVSRPSDPRLPGPGGAAARRVRRAGGLRGIQRGTARRYSR